MRAAGILFTSRHPTKQNKQKRTSLPKASDRSGSETISAFRVDPIEVLMAISKESQKCKEETGRHRAAIDHAAKHVAKSTGIKSHQVKSDKIS